MTPPLAVLLRSLRLAGLDIDAEAALDSLWLGCEIRDKERIGATSGRRPSGETVVGDRPSSATPRPEDGEKRPSGSKPRRDSLSVRTGEFATPAAATSADAAAPARTLTLARAAALPASRELINALRPLRRRVVSPGAGVLDIDATVRRAAEEDLWFPTFASARERWLDVLLVADHGLSMIFWKDTIDEFERVLRNAGAFRSVRSWWLESDADKPAISARGRGPVPATPEGLARLTRGAGRSVVLVVSDCVGARWHDGAIPRLVGTWSRALPVALMQVTPEWFWARTALGDTVGSRFRSAVPAAVNHRFHWDATALGAGGVSTEEEKTLLRMPATTLTANAVARLAGLIAGVGREWAPGVIFDLTWSPDEEPAQGPAITADQRVARFRTLASIAALRLAAAFAASPVRTLGVLRLLRRDLLPDASPFAEAEVMLGGIVRVKRDEARWDLGASLPLEFVPGVQHLLLDGAVAGDVLRVLSHAAVVAQSGVGPTFTSWLENPSSGAAQLDPAESAFAAAAATVLERLGGAYAQIVKPVSPVREQQSTTAEQKQTAALTDQLAHSVGRPHRLPYSDALIGRDAEFLQVDRWFTTSVEQRVLFTGAVEQRILSVVGPEGIGKSALAAHALVQWYKRGPDNEPFVWCFQRESTAGEMIRALRAHADVQSESSAILPDVLKALSQRKRSLLIFDGVDGIQSPSDLDEVLATATAIASVMSARVLVTGRESLAERIRAQQIALGPLDPEGVEALVRALLSRSAVPLFSDEERRVLMPLVQELGDGNPLVIKTLIEHAVAISPEMLLEELAPGYGERREIAAHQLPGIEDQLTQAARARELSSMGKTLFDAGNMRQAFKAFDDAVGLRERLPSRRFRADALFDRGRTSLLLKDFDRADADLFEAARLYRMISAHREVVPALEALAEARAATGRSEQAIRVLREALELVRANDDSASTVRVLLHLAPMLPVRGALDEALKLLDEANEIAPLVGDERAIGVAYLEIGRLRHRMFNASGAISAAHAAIAHLSKTEDRTALAEAFEDLAEACVSSNNVVAARSALERLKELRPDQAASIDDRLRRLASLETSAAQKAQTQTPPPGDVLQGDDDRVLTVEFLISGRVAGVGFRVFVDRCFKEIPGVGGSATNLPDGRIRVNATGPRSRLQQLQERVRRGPPAAKVEQVVTTILDQGAPAGESTATAEAREPKHAEQQRSVRVFQRAVVAIGIKRVGDQLPELPAAPDAARRFAEWAMYSQHIPTDRVTLLTDDSGPVTARRIFDAVTSNIELGRLDQLIIYFAGYSANVRAAEYWLLAQATNDPSGSVSVERSKEVARHAGVPHVVFVSDTCHVSPASAQTVAGEAVLPNKVTSIPGVVDQFFSALPIDDPARQTFEGGASEEIRIVADPARQYRAAYTTVLLSALGGAEASVHEERDGVRFVRPRALSAYLRTAVPQYLRSLGVPVDLQQEPEARIESGGDAWLARFEPHVKPVSR